MKIFNYNGIILNSDMSLYEIRQKVYGYLDVNMSDKIRVFSLLYFETQRICTELNIPFFGYFGAIGDFRIESFSIEVQQNLGYTVNSNQYKKIRSEENLYIKQLREKGMSEYRYDLSGFGYRELRGLLQKQQKERLGIDFNIEDDKTNTYNEIFVTAGASVGIKAAFEAIHRILKRKPKVLFPVPLFLPVVKASECLIEPILFETQEHHNFKLTPDDINTLAASGKNIDVLYLCPLNNPTSISYSGKELERLLDTILFHFEGISIVIDNVYFASLDSKNAQELARVFQKPQILERSIFIDSEGKAKACTGKRSGAIYTKNKEYGYMIGDVLRNGTGGCPSSMMIETVAQLRSIEDSISESIYSEVRRRRNSFLEHIFNTPGIQEYLEAKDLQTGLPYGHDWTGGLYAFIRLKDTVDCTDFILKTGLIGSPGSIFGSTRYANYVRFSFGFEDFTLKPNTEGIK